MRIDAPMPDPPPLPILNILSFLLPVIIPATQVAVACRLAAAAPWLPPSLWRDVAPLYLMVQYLAGFYVGTLVATAAPTARQRAAARHFAIGSMAIPIGILLLLPLTLIAMITFATFA